jgi:hypothetical protein
MPSESADDAHLEKPAEEIPSPWRRDWKMDLLMKPEVELSRQREFAEEAGRPGCAAWLC